MKPDISVIGTGISGLSISQMLSKKYNVIVFEKEEKIGGLIKCDRVKNVLFHKVGGHVFNSNNKSVLDWFWRFFNKEDEFIKAKRNAKILLNDNYVGYPIEDHLYQLDPKDIKIIIKELLKINTEKIEVNNIRSFKDFLISVFGKHLYKIYFEPYNNKIWNTNLEAIPLEWLEGKLPMPNIFNIILNNIMKKEESEMVHSTFYYPKYNGSQYIVDRLSRNLEIKTKFKIFSINRSINNKLILNHSKKQFNHLIYTGDIRLLNQMLNIEDKKLKKLLFLATKLKSNGTSNVLCYTDKSDLSWLYLPNPNTKAHRIIYTGNFSNTNNSKKYKNTCVVEFSGLVNQEIINEELLKLPGNLVPIEYNYEKNSYIIQDSSTRNLINQIKIELEKYNIHLLGRFAEWEYYNMDKCIESAFSLEKKINSLYE
jgi:protoporphyrinogen oxidase